MRGEAFILSERIGDARERLVQICLKQFLVGHAVRHFAQAIEIVRERDQPRLLTCQRLVSAADLRKKRKYAIVIAFIMAAVLTPPDPVSQIGLALPALILYEVSILCVRQIEKNREKREAAEAVT